MEFRRITNLPPYVFTIINNLKIEARRAGADVIDLGFGNPDIPSPQIAVEKLAEAAHNPRNHRYSLSRGLPKLREAIAALYERKWDVDLDPELEITNTIGSKEGFSHLMWVLLDRGDAAIVPSPSYPIHIYGPLFAGADLRQVPMRHLADPRVQRLRRRLLRQPHHRVRRRLAEAAGARDLVPAQPDRRVRRPAVHAARRRLLPRARDDRRPRLRLRRHRLRRVRAAEHPAGRGCQGVRGRAVLDDQELLDGRLALSPSCVGNAEVVQALVKLKSYLDYGTFQPVQIAATVTMNEAPDYPKEVCAHLPGPPRRADRRPRPDRLGHPQAEGLDVRVGADPRAVRRDGLGRVLLARGRASATSRCRPASASARWRGLRPLRADRERAAHRPGHPQPADGPAPSSAERCDASRFTQPSHGGHGPNTTRR